MLPFFADHLEVERNLAEPSLNLAQSYQGDAEAQFFGVPHQQHLNAASQARRAVMPGAKTPSKSAHRAPVYAKAPAPVSVSKAFRKAPQ
jgi:hypothetical protein|mmetsp:Transcript_44553/g.59113  ORF Transcript_44553/g.59113 Transcript_44553/m.59113 type:complete len:89 (-) Transcript_44553:547-813(-)